MKKIFLVLLCMLSVCAARAQSETKSFNVNGIKVIFKPTTKNVFTIRLYFRGGVTNYPADKAGLELLTLDAVTACGSQNHAKDAIKDTLNRYDIGMYGTSSYDYGFIQLNCVSKYFDNAWNLFADVARNPIFDTDEVNLLKAKLMADTRRYFSNPENVLYQLQMQNNFKGTPYMTAPTGTEESLKKFNADDLKSYYKSLLVKNKIFIVAVGNIDKQELYEKILLAFSGIPDGSYNTTNLETPALNDGKLLAEDHQMSVNYIGATMNAPQFTSKDYVPFRLGISGLAGNLYGYLRTNRNLSWSSHAGTQALRMPFALMAASSTNVRETIDGMVAVLRGIKEGEMNDEWLQRIKNSYITTNLVTQQSSIQIAAGLGEAEALGGWQYAENLTELVKMVTSQQVNDALQSYITGLRWTYFGNEDAIKGIKMPAY